MESGHDMWALPTEREANAYFLVSFGLLLVAGFGVATMDLSYRHLYVPTAAVAYTAGILYIVRS